MLKGYEIVLKSRILPYPITDSFGKQPLRSETSVAIVAVLNKSDTKFDS